MISDVYLFTSRAAREQASKRGYVAGTGGTSIHRRNTLSLVRRDGSTPNGGTNILSLRLYAILIPVTALSWKHRDHFGLRKESGKPIDFSGYNRLFGRERVIEHDHRFARREDIVSAVHRPRCVYGNMLDEALDYVGRFENLADDMAFVRRRVGISRPFDLHVERSPTLAREALTAEDRSWIATTYAEDFATFGYAVGR